MTRVIKRREKMARRSRINTDVKPVRKIDIVNASKDELIEYLCQTINYEVEKGDDADCDLIRECSDWLDELTADLMVFTPEELEAKLEALKSGKDVPIFHPHKPPQTTSVPKIKRKVFVRVGILVAAIMLLSVLSLSVMAKHAGYDSTWEYISVNVGKLFGLNSGELIREDGITVIKPNGSITYKNIDDFLNAESLNIMYPYILPNDIKISEVRYINKQDNKYTLRFVFTNNSYEFAVSNYYLADITKMGEMTSIEINGITFYITQKEDGKYFSLCQNNGYEYTIQSPNYDDLLIIINNTRG